mgnify:CR=1 FL=1
MKVKTGLLTLLLFFSTILTIRTQTRNEIRLSRDDFDFSRLVLLKEINKLDMKFPHIVFSQALLETGNFSSKLFQNYNNLFGMKVPLKRESLARGKTKAGYAKYEFWSNSIYDYFLWQTYMMEKHKVKTEKQYFTLLGKVYSQDKGYVLRVKRVLKENQDILN